MDNLSIELKAISIEGEIWKPFVKTSLKDYYISVPSDYAIDACYGLIIKLHELKML